MSILTRSEIYREAASRVADGVDEYSCDAVYMAGDGDAREAYADLFAPNDYTSIFSKWGHSWGRDKVDCRILALLFMAAISEDDE